MFEWDRSNLRKIRAHGIRREEAEQVLLSDPVPIYEQDVEGEVRFVYYGETEAGRLRSRCRSLRAKAMRRIGGPALRGAAM